MTSEAVLLVGGGPGRDYPCLRSLAESGIRTIFARTDRQSSVPASRFCEETCFLPSPMADLDGFRRELLALAQLPCVGTIVPSREDVVYLLSKDREAFEEHVSLVVPPFEVLRSVQDRLLLFEAATEAGVPVPETRLLSEDRDWSTRAIVKSRFNLLAEPFVDGFPQNRVAVNKDIEHLEPGERPAVDAIEESMEHTPIVQEYVPTSDEFVFGALYDHGDPVVTFQHRQVRGDSYLGGGGVYRKSIYRQELQDVAERLLSHLDWHGLACIEYMRHAETGEYVLTEVNPRTWKSISTAVRAGVDFPLYYWLSASGRGAAIEPGYEVGVGTHSLYGEAHHLLSLVRDRSPHVDPPSVPRTAWGVARSLVADPHFDVTRLDDPGPAIVATWNLLRSTDS